MKKPIVVLSAIAIRLFLIFNTGGGYDLQIYRYFGNIVANGGNPYLAPENGAISPVYADMSPLNMMLFAGILPVHNSDIAIRLFLGLADILVVVSLLFFPNRDKSWRESVALFYAISPIVLYGFTIVAEDKSLIFLLLVLVFAMIESGHPTLAILATTTLAIYKWMGVFFVIPLIFHVSKSQRDIILYGLLFATLFIASHIPYFPDNLLAYKYREARTLFDPPIHSSITILLSSIGFYTPAIVKLFIPSSLIVVYALYAFKRINIATCIALSIFFAYLPAPEMGFDRIVLISLPLLFIVKLSHSRIVQIWILATASVLGFLFTQYSSPLNVVVSYLMPIALLGMFLYDNLNGRVAQWFVHPSYTRLTVGSSPTSPTMKGQ